MTLYPTDSQTDVPTPFNPCYRQIKPDRRLDAVLDQDSPARPTPQRQSTHRLPSPTDAPTPIDPRPDGNLPTLSPISQRRSCPRLRPTEVPTPFATPFNQHCQPDRRPDTDQPTLLPASRRRSRPQRRPTEAPTPFAMPFDQHCQQTNAPTPINSRPDANKPTLSPKSRRRSHPRLRLTEVLKPFATPFNQPRLRPTEAKTDQHPYAVRIRGANLLSFRPVRLTKFPTPFAPRSPNHD